MQQINGAYPTKLHQTTTCLTLNPHTLSPGVTSTYHQAWVAQVCLETRNIFGFFIDYIIFHCIFDYIICDCIIDLIICESIFVVIICDYKSDYTICDYLFDYIIYDCIFFYSKWIIYDARKSFLFLLLLKVFP